MDVDRVVNIGTGHWRVRMRRHRVLLTFLVVSVTLPAVLSPTHPVAVYGYLADTYVISYLSPPATHAKTSLAAFLITPAQVQRYRAGLREDMLDTRGGKLFAIVYRPDGSPLQQPVRTWNDFLPPGLPGPLENWLDLKEFPYLGDEVALWMKHGRIAAMGHYHPFGGGPSRGDKYAHILARVPEIVVSNGLVPIVYLNGELVPYGSEIQIANDVFRSMRALERSLVMDSGGLPPISLEPSDRLKSFLAFLETYRNVDIEDKKSIARDVQRLCADFKSDYGMVFPRGFRQSYYQDSQDKANFVLNLLNLELWAVYVTNPPVRHVFPAAEVHV